MTYTEWALAPCIYWPQLLNGLGELDGKIRDELIYNSLCCFIRGSENTRESNKKMYLTLKSSEFLFDEGTEMTKVLKRSFSALLLSDLINQDRKEWREISSEELDQLVQKIEENLPREKEKRDFVEVIGWIHIYAHFGDALSSIMVHGNCHQKTAQRIKGLLESCSESGLSEETTTRLRSALILGEALNKI